MAGVMQPGDVVTFSKLAWQVYQFGWQDELHAAKQYRDFGEDVRGLAEHLDVLERVVANAKSTLLSRGSFTTPIRLDPYSLKQIIGDYEQTLKECVDLLRVNRAYGMSDSVRRNLEWNVLVQPSVQRLQQRLLLHHSKIKLLLKPLEIDLLTRIHEDLNRLGYQISALHNDVRRIMGVVVPEFQYKPEPQMAAEGRMLEIPSALISKFEDTAKLAQLLEERGHRKILEDLLDAYVVHFQSSTIAFRPGLLVEEKVPPVDQYINLLKCVWLMSLLRELLESQSPTQDSHWPSFISRLEEELSLECLRCSRELATPQNIVATEEMCSILPQAESPRLVDVVPVSSAAEEILSIPLNATTGFPERQLVLSRLLGTKGTKFRAVISGLKTAPDGSSRKQDEPPLSFDVTSAVINPLYAHPDPRIATPDLILRTEHSIARLSFRNIDDILKFQQSVLGFKAWAGYRQYNVRASFAVDGERSLVSEDACVQLWIPKQVEGKLITSQKPVKKNDINAQITSRSLGDNSTCPWSARDNFFSSPDPFSSVFKDARASSVQNSPPFPHFTFSEPTSPIQKKDYSNRPDPNSQGSTFAGPMSTATPNQLSPPFSAPTSPQPNMLSATRPHRLSTASMDTSDPLSTGSNSSRSSGYATTTVQVGSGTTGIVHRQPLRPMLVLFTRGSTPSTAGRLSIIVVQLDESTAFNPQRCDCRKRGDAGDACKSVAIEQKEGKGYLNTQRFASRSETVEHQWDLARLSAARRGERAFAEAAWQKVTRVSLAFPDATARHQFAGTPSRCRCKAKKDSEVAKCLSEGHQGLLGEVKRHYRLETDKYHRAFAEQRHLVTGQREDSLGTP